MKNELVIGTPQQQALRNEQVQQTFRKERKQLLEFIRRRVSGSAEAEDILQDVFEQFIEHFSPIKPIEQITAWLYRVARNRIIDRYRKHKPDSVEDHRLSTESYEEAGRALTVADLLIDTDNNPENAYLREMVWETLALALNELPAEQRDVFVAHELEDKSFREIADQTGASINTLLSRKRYAVLYLRERLQNLYNELLDT